MGTFGESIELSREMRVQLFMRHDCGTPHTSHLAGVTTKVEVGITVTSRELHALN